jgi:pyruvate ferredoxin oxidoreductase gamma subunit
MREIRFHGRGGQGAVTAATLLAIAAFKDGKYSQAFPKFGVERRGAPVQAFTRISDEFIKRKSAIYKPDILVVLDPTLFAVVNVTKGLVKDGKVIINTEKNPDKFNIKDAEIHAVDATSLAFEILGLDIVNTAMLGAFAAFIGEIKKESICDAVRENFPKHLAEKNVMLVEKTYDRIMEEIR